MPSPASPYRRLLPLLGLGAAGFLFNLIRFELFFDVDFIFGSVFVMLALLDLGLGAGLAAAAVAGSATWIIWHHPWALVILLGEAAFVGWLVRRRSRDLILSDILYWLVLGGPLVWIFYHLVLHASVQTTTLVFLKQSINGLLNALLAYLIHLAWRARRQPGDAPRPGFRPAVFVTLVSLVVLPALLYLAFYIRQEFRHVQQGMLRQGGELERVSAQSLRAWIEDRHGSIATLAGLVARPDLGREHQQRAVEVIRSVTPAFKRVGVLDVHANVVAFSPLFDDAGQSNLKRNFADRPYIQIMKEDLRPRVADVVMGRIGRPEPIIPLVVPILREGRYDGYCIGVTDTSQVQELLRLISGPGGPRLTLLDRTGHVVASTRADLPVMSAYQPPPGEVRPLEPGAWQAIPRPQPSRSLMQRWADSSIVQEGLLGPDLPWKVMVESPMAPLVAELTRLSILGLGILLFLILLTVALAQALSRGLTVAIGRLEAATRAFPARLHEDPGTPMALSDSGIEEMHHLNDRFQRMADALRVSFRELRDLKDTLEQRVATRTQELQTALDTIKTLHGIIPICASCKKIRDDKGSWNQLETYISEHTEADFSHGICPDCARRLYPEMRPRKPG